MTLEETLILHIISIYAIAFQPGQVLCVCPRSVYVHSDVTWQSNMALHGSAFHASNSIFGEAKHPEFFCFFSKTPLFSATKLNDWSAKELFMCLKDCFHSLNHMPNPFTYLESHNKFTVTYLDTLILWIRDISLWSRCLNVLYSYEIYIYIYIYIV